MQDVFAGTTQERLIVFDENYLSIDSNYNPVFLKRDAEFVEVVLKIVTYSSMGMVNRFSSGVGLYSYEMKDTGDTYEFVLNYLLIGPDASSDDAKSERLRMHQERYAIDKVTGISESSAFSTGILRSYILTDAELDRLEEIVASRGF
jgi:hypothetical protein